MIELIYPFRPFEYPEGWIRGVIEGPAYIAALFLVEMVILPLVGVEDYNDWVVGVVTGVFEAGQAFGITYVAGWLLTRKKVDGK